MYTKNNQEKHTKDVVGVWRVTEIMRQGGSAPITVQPLPSIIIFTKSHYSMAWVFEAEDQQGFAKRWQPTDAEKIKRFDSLVVNSGTYEIEASTLTAHPIIARIPGFVGGKLVCEYHVDNDTMRLKFLDEYSFDGVQAPWVTSGGLVLTLVRIE